MQFVNNQSSPPSRCDDTRPRGVPLPKIPNRGEFKGPLTGTVSATHHSPPNIYPAKLAFFLAALFMLNSRGISRRRCASDEKRSEKTSSCQLNNFY